MNSKRGQKPGKWHLESRWLPQSIIRSILNSCACGREFARRFKPVNATKVLTAEISGIAPAISTGLHLGLPVVYARKHKPITMPDEVLLTLSPSHTKGRMVELIISPEYLAGGERVLIIDDFLATGATINGLVRLANAAGAVVVGIGALIEKIFEGGRDSLSYLGIPHRIAGLHPINGK